MRLIALVESAAAVCLFPLLFLTPGSVLVKGFIAVALAFYARLKLGDYRAATLQTRQLRLEERFVQQNLKLIQLAQCFGQQGHLWAPSLVLKGLQGVQAHPLPRMLSPDARVERLRLHFHRALQDLMRDRLYLDWVPAAFAGALTLSYVWPSTSETAGWLLPAALGMLACIGAAEGTGIALRRATRAGFEELERTLSTWALEANLCRVMFDRRKLYAHTLLYEARPWFSVHPGVRGEAGQ